MFITNSMKTLKMAHIKTILKKKKKAVRNHRMFCFVRE